MKYLTSLAFVAFLWALWPLHSSSELIVNVSKNKTHPYDGIVRQIISGNSSTDTVTIEYNLVSNSNIKSIYGCKSQLFFIFLQADGTLVTLLTDFRTNTQITRVILAGEEELNEPRAQTLCFITSFTNDLITPEAVMKLRQKNPGAVRTADDDLGETVIETSIRLQIRSYALISSHLSKMCRGDTFSSQNELSNIFEGNNGKLTAVTSESGYENLQKCYYLDYHESNNMACICSRQICFHWIPCALKYCKNRGDDGEMTEHRCGIKTCQKCTTFRYKTKTKLHCLWDDQ